MEELTQLGFDDFLDRTAKRTPTPGGGSVTGAAGALAATLARMVAAYSRNKKTDPEIRTRIESVEVQLDRIDQLIRALVTRDAIVYSQLTEASRAAKSAADDPAAGDRLADAVLAAVAVPMEMAALMSSLLMILDEVKAILNRHLLSDLGIAAVLANATTRSARYTVGINVGEVADVQTRTRILAELDDIAGHCAQRRESIESYLQEHLARSS